MEIMQTKIEDLGNERILMQLEGRLDAAGAEMAEPGLREAGGGASRLLVDLSAVPFIASAGIRILLATAKAMSRRGAELHIVSPSPTVREVLVIAGIDMLLPIHDTPDAAL
jgi:anti-anti-sigma factor